MGLSSQLASSSLARPGVCTSSTRPASPYEGQVIYETDTDLLALWTGAAWRYISATTTTNGSILQIQTSSHSTVASTSGTSFVDSNLTVSITPKLSTSKILVTANLCGGKVPAINTGIIARLVRDSTGLVTFSQYHGYTTASTDTNFFVGSVTWLDSPSTTSATTYKVQFARQGGSGTVEVQNNSTTSTICVMEVAG